MHRNTIGQIDSKSDSKCGSRNSLNQTPVSNASGRPKFVKPPKSKSPAASEEKPDNQNISRNLHSGGLSQTNEEIEGYSSQFEKQSVKSEDKSKPTVLRIEPCSQSEKSEPKEDAS